MTRKLLLAAALLALIGAGLIGYAATLPLYTDPHAPIRLSAKIPPGNLQEWYAQLAAFETSKKQFWNWGQGLLSFGLGLAGAIGVLRLYLHHPRFRNVESFFLGWNVVWLLRFPATIYYYNLHSSWLEYPEWMDSLSTLVLREFTAWIVGALVTSAFLLAFVFRRQMPERLHWNPPTGFLGWVRTGILVAWELLLALLAIASVPYGDVGTILSSLLGGAFLLLLLCAEKKVTPLPSTRSVD